MAADAEAIVVQPDGKILVGGSAGGAAALARLRPDGALDTSFGGSAAFGHQPGKLVLRVHRKALSIALQGHKIVLAGAAGAGWVGRFTAAGELDRSFGTGKGGYVRLPPAPKSKVRLHTSARVGVVRVTADDKIYAAGFRQRRLHARSPARLAKASPAIAAVASSSPATWLPERRGGRIVVAASAEPGLSGSPARPHFAAVRYLSPIGSRDPGFFGDGIFEASFGALRSVAWDPLVDHLGRLVISGEADPGPNVGDREERILLARFRG